MQKRILLAAFAGVLFFIGLTVYLEIGKRNITENPSQLPPAEQPSKVVEQPSDDVSAGEATQTQEDASQMGIHAEKKDARRLQQVNRWRSGKKEKARAGSRRIRYTYRTVEHE